MNNILCGEALNVLRNIPKESFQMCVTSPPYYCLRDYGSESQIGLEETPEKYIERLTEIFMEVFRVLKYDGTLWINIADSYHKNSKKKVISSYEREKQGNNSFRNHKYSDRVSTNQDISSLKIKQKDLIGIPWMLAFSLREKGWYLRSDIIWNKPNALPESIKDRPSKSYEHLFLFSKSQKYFFDYESVMEVTTDRKGIRRIRDVWNINTKPFNGPHTATFPLELVKRCILAGSNKGDIILDPFLGSGTTGLAAVILGRKYTGIELNQKYCDLAEKRISGTSVVQEETNWIQVRLF